jgi:hypothetical protein
MRNTGQISELQTTSIMNICIPNIIQRRGDQANRKMKLPPRHPHGADRAEHEYKPRHHPSPSSPPSMTELFLSCGGSSLQARGRRCSTDMAGRSDSSATYVVWWAVSGHVASPRAVHVEVERCSSGASGKRMLVGCGEGVSACEVLWSSVVGGSSILLTFTMGSSSRRMPYTNSSWCQQQWRLASPSLLDCIVLELQLRMTWAVWRSPGENLSCIGRRWRWRTRHYLVVDVALELLDLVVWQVVRFIAARQDGYVVKKCVGWGIGPKRWCYIKEADSISSTSMVLYMGRAMD